MGQIASARNTHKLLKDWSELSDFKKKAHISFARQKILLPGGSEKSYYEMMLSPSLKARWGSLFFTGLFLSQWHRLHSMRPRTEGRTATPSTSTATKNCLHKSVWATLQSCPDVKPANYFSIRALLSVIHSKCQLKPSLLRASMSLFPWVWSGQTGNWQICLQANQKVSMSSSYYSSRECFLHLWSPGKLCNPPGASAERGWGKNPHSLLNVVYK